MLRDDSDAADGPEYFSQANLKRLENYDLSYRRSARIISARFDAAKELHRAIFLQLSPRARVLEHDREISLQVGHEQEYDFKGTIS